MDYENKNVILNVFFNEGPPRERSRIRRHLKRCVDCSAYLDDLRRIDAGLRMLDDAAPAADTFDRILRELPEPAVQAAAKDRHSLSPLPFFEIAGGLLLIVLMLYGAVSCIPLLPVWDHLKDTWLLRTFGLLPVTVSAFLAVGTVITLALYPVAYFEIDSKRRPVLSD